MSNKLTPETNAAEWFWYGDCAPEEEMIVPADLARKLERERDEAKDAIRALAEHGESEIQRITKERDEAITRRMETIMQCELYEQERDEAQKEVEYYKARYEQLKEETK